jgi:hypothetical protein
VFTGEALGADLDLAGPVRLSAVVWGDGAHAQLAAKLVDVFESGRARRILQGIARVPTGGGHVVVDLGHTGYRVCAGHRLRLELAASDVPRYLRIRGPPRTRGPRRASDPPSARCVSAAPTVPSSSSRCAHEHGDEPHPDGTVGAGPPGPGTPTPPRPARARRPRLASHVPGVDLYLFPELYTTGDDP